MPDRNKKPKVKTRSEGGNKNIRNSGVTFKPTKSKPPTKTNSVVSNIAKAITPKKKIVPATMPYTERPNTHPKKMKPIMSPMGEWTRNRSNGTWNPTKSLAEGRTEPRPQLDTHVGYGNKKKK